MVSSILFLMALAASSSNATAVSSNGAKPKWVVNYAPASCILSRARSGANGGLAIETRPFENYHDVIFLLPKVGGKPIEKLGSLSARDLKQSDERTVSVQEPKGVADRVVRTTISDDQLALAARQQMLGVTIPKTLDEQVSLAGIGKALHAIELCNRRLLSKWGATKT